ncbi:FAD-dependent oxidoreductase [Parenemella sanctibonifatiensis]|uniref:FAD-dependent oxidoreductase n=1 Tax=Parenemella sanctibonifatiensis TaxID=2016505 RepID=A0A255E690_9ACTN|nr:FAD-dependent oxidoreductase [Parenemella sanctibonifatiensis]OYN86471.1 FAD-dependent oxidoreductase [Parenemella sanctibonifatiensis]
MPELQADVLIVGGGVGGVAGALGALSQGVRVILTEESPWLGGQLTNQAVPPDEHPWIETQTPTRSYGWFRTLVRKRYQRRPGITDAARQNPVLNPGSGGVSKLCAEPREYLAALEEMLAPYQAGGQLVVLTEVDPTAAETEGDRITSVTFTDRSGDQTTITAPYVLDATEEGQLLELAGVEHVMGAESREDTGELHAIDGPAQPLNQQSFTWCFAVDYFPEEDHTIERPADYDRWRDYVPGDFWPGKLLAFRDVHPISREARDRAIFHHDDSWLGGGGGDFWHYRRIMTVKHYQPGTYASDVTLVNWPQIDYMAGPLQGVSDAERQANLDASRQLSLSFLYWMQTEAPRRDGGTGYAGLRPRGDLLGSTDDLALRPYIRESRRIKAEFTVLEQHVGVEARKAAGLDEGSALFDDTVGVGSYRIDLHPRTGGGNGPENYIDIANYPFQLPLGSLIPERVENLLPAGKNIGSTHITNGCYRLHPVEWVIGEVAGALAGRSVKTGTTPRAVRNTPGLLEDFQQLLTTQLGFQLAWPEATRRTPR